MGNVITGSPEGPSDKEGGRRSSSPGCRLDDSYVYVIFDPFGVPCYVGKGRGRRVFRSLATSDNQRLRRTSQKYGALPWVKIREGISEVVAFEIERALIKAIGRADLGKGPLFNLTDGGEGVTGARHTEEWLRKFSAARKGIPHTPEHIERIRAALTGTKRAPLTEEHKSRLRASHAESAAVKEHIRELAEKSRGKPLSLEHREKVRQANLGAKRSEAARQAMSVAQKRRFTDSVGKQRPWEAAGVSRRTWYRRREGASAA